MAWIVQNIYPQVQSIKYPQSTDKSQDITAREMSWKHERIHRGLFTSHHLDLVTGCQEAFYPGICPGFTNIFAGLRIISSRTRIVPEHASWEQGYHGIIIPITREIQNREHFNLGPGTFVSRNSNSLFSAPRGPGSRQSCGVREICVFFIFPALPVFCNPSSSRLLRLRCPALPRLSSCQCFAEWGQHRGHSCLSVPTPAPKEERGLHVTSKKVSRVDWGLTWSLWRIAWPALCINGLSYGRNGQFYDPGCQ